MLRQSTRLIVTADIEDYDDVLFKPDKYAALLIGCSEYEKLRQKDGFQAFNDMPSALKELDKVKENLYKIDFKDEDIVALENPLCKDVKQAFDDLLEKIWLNYMNQEKTLVFFYFMGHGSQDQECKILFNGQNEVFPIEELLTLVAGTQNTYVLSLLDCTRKRVDVQVWGQTAKQSELNADQIDKFVSTDFLEAKTNVNQLSSYICPPSQDVCSKPSSVFFYFKHLMLKKEADDIVNLPSALDDYKGADDKCEHKITGKAELEIVWKGVDYGDITDTLIEGDSYYKGTVNADGVKHGQGYLKLSSGTSYEGDFWKGTYQGIGTMKFASGNIYDGEWRDGVRSGCGESRFPKGDRYIGTYDKDKKHGEGSYFYANGNKYIGGWDMDTRHGTGTYEFVNGEYYNGGYVHNKREGYAVYRNKNGESYQGNYLDGKRNGQGQYFYTTGATYVGEWVNDTKAGKGVYTFATKEKYDGYYENGVRHGEGTYYYKNGDIYEGPWENDKRNGIAKYTFANGSIKKGEFNEGNFVKWLADVVEEDEDKKDDDDVDDVDSVAE